jgi:hypothetical protein
MEGAPPIANQIDLFMHFLGASRDGLVARRVDLDTISSSVKNYHIVMIRLLLVAKLDLVQNKKKKQGKNQKKN